MNFSKKNHEIVRQNDQNVKKSQKHDANLQKNTTLYFQVGLILTLFAVYGLFEMKTELKPIEVAVLDPIEEDYMFNKKVKVFEEVSQKVEKKKQKPVILKDPIIMDNDHVDIQETDNVIAEPLTSDTPPAKIEEVTVVEISEEVEPINIMAVQQVPIYPGCEGLTTNKQRRNCMQKKLAKLIDRKFDKDLASSLGLSSGKKRINVQFKIDKSGHVTDIKARAPHSRLEKEAQRVIGKVPQMTPGKQKDKNVDVIYQLPILFMVEY